MKAQQKKLSGCASNLLAHEDLGHLRRPIVGIYKPSSIMKIPTSILKWQNKRLSIMKIMVLLWSTSVEKKDSSIAPFYFFFLGLPFFYLAFLFFYWDNALLNDDHHTSIYLQLNDYNSILEQRYDSIWMPLAVYRDVQWSSVAVKSKNGQAMKTSC